MTSAPNRLPCSNALLCSQIPMIHSAQHVKLSNKSDLVLVTYAHKEPQLFRLTLPPKSSTHLAVLHSCHYPSAERDFEAVGPCSLGSLTAQTEEDQIIVCAGKGKSSDEVFRVATRSERTTEQTFFLPLDEIRLWDRESGRLFGTTSPQDDDVEYTCAAWNHWSPDTMMLAAGGNDGTLRIWKASLLDTPLPASV